MDIIKKRKTEDGDSNGRIREIEWIIRKREFENNKIKKEKEERIIFREYYDKNKNNDFKKQQENSNNNEDLEKKFEKLILEQPKTIVSNQREGIENKEEKQNNNITEKREDKIKNLETFLQENKSESYNKTEIGKLKEELQAKIEKVEKKPINVNVFESEVINPVEFLLTNDYCVNLRGVIPYDEAYTQITSYVLCAIFGNLAGLAMMSTGFLAPFAPALMMYSSVPTFALKIGLKTFDSQTGDILHLSGYKSLTDLLIEYKAKRMRNNINLKISNEKVRRTIVLENKLEKKKDKLNKDLEFLEKETENIVEYLDNIDKNKEIKLNKHDIVKKIIEEKRNIKSFAEKEKENKENQNFNGLSLKK